MSNGFLNEQRLLDGPWQGLERDVARLFLANGFQDIRLVGGSGDKGADILAVKDGALSVVQVKYTSSSSPPKAALDEVVEAGRYYKADRLIVATSRPPGDAFLAEIAKFDRAGLKIEVFGPEMLMHLMSITPDYAPDRKELREYQSQISERLRQVLVDTGRGQIVLATGLGKTVVMAETVADLLRDQVVPNNRVLVLAHTRELVRQLHKGFWYQLPKWIPTHQLMDGEIPTFWEGVTFATIQSVMSRLNSLPEFGLVVVDEAHHIGSESFRKAIEVLSPAMIAGATATPWRGDGYDIDQILGPAVAQMGIAEGLRGGFLSEVDYRLYADNLDWKVIQEASNFHYSVSQLNKRLMIPTRDEKAAEKIWSTFREENRKSCIVFSPTISHANEFAALLRQFDFKAEAISNETPPRDQDALMAKFRAGSLDIVVTVDLFNEGVDVPDVDTVVFMRSTHSRRIFVQQIGRGLRISHGKDKVVVLDFVSDLRRIAEVIELEAAASDGSVERMPLGRHLINFSDVTAGNFMREWMLDQANLFLREDDPKLTLPQFEFPKPPGTGNIE